MVEYDFNMYLTEDDNGLPLIVMRFAGLQDFDEAEELAEELFKIISGTDEPVTIAELH